MQGCQPLKRSEREEIERVISHLTTTRKSVCQGMVVALEYSASARDITQIIFDQISDFIDSAMKNAPLELKTLYAKLYLISDILFNSSNP